MKAHLENAKKWEEISSGIKIVSRKVVVERNNKSEQEGTEDDFSGFGESLIEKSMVTWKDIGGLDEVKSHIKETIVIAGSSKPESVKPDKGILLFGPPEPEKHFLPLQLQGVLKQHFLTLKSVISSPNILENHQN